MKKTTQKITVACAIGGILFCITALIFAPQYWYIGILAGFAGGYISFEFKEVLKSIPIALNKAYASLNLPSKKELKEIKDDSIVWFGEPHPYVYGALFLNVLFCYYFFFTGGDPFRNMVHEKDYETRRIFFSFFLPVMSLTVIMILMKGLTAIGSPRDRIVAYMQNRESSYKNVYSRLFIGIFRTIVFFVYGLWAKIIVFVAKFIWTMFKLVHSNKRMLCAVDGTLGGTISYLWLHSSAVSLMQQTILVFFGGIIGAALGILSWEIISRRVFKIETA